MDEQLQELRDRFGRAVAAAGGGAPGQVVFDDLLARYGEAHRHYHTLEHVAACLAGLDRWRQAAERPEEVELALWFHDAIYDPHGGDSERRSADLARAQLAALGVPSGAIDRVARSVEATERHEARGGDEALVIDIDLAILGASPDEVDRFERRIRQEYAHVPDALYRAGRRQVLQGFLSRPAIYQVPPVRAALEARARANLQRLVEQLSGQSAREPELRLRPATMDDLAMLRRWDEAPQVVESDPNDDWGWEEELARSPDWREQLIAEVDGTPIGFIQIIDPAREDSHYWGDCPADLRAIDIWIGEEAYLGRGLGTRMMQQALERCFADPRVPAVLIDPLASNTRARRFYERLGFRFVEHRRFGLDDCAVYRLDRGDWSRRHASGDTH